MLSWVQEAETVLGIKLSTANRNEERAADGPCPVCGGTDRFLVYRESGYSYCTQCGYRKWWREPQKGSKEKAKEDLMNDRKGLVIKLNRKIKWHVYNQDLLNNPSFSDFLSELERKRGITKDTVSKFGIGIVGDFVSYKKGEENHLGTAITIPIFIKKRFVDLRYNILYPPTKKGMKYRSHFSGFIPFPYNIDDAVPGSPILIVEGEFKTIVIKQFFPDLKVIGILGKNLIKYFMIDMRHFEKIKDRSFIICLDPGAEKEAYRLAEEIQLSGGNVNIAYFPDKPDDFLIEHGSDYFMKVIEQAI